MPSSSNFDTHQERLIFDCHKILCARLWHVGYHDEAHIITEWFVDVLESSRGELFRNASSDTKWWEQMGDYCNRPGKPRSDSIYAAGNMAADSAAVLFRFGRNKEAERFCEHADQIYNWAMRVEDKERSQSSWSISN